MFVGPSTDRAGIHGFELASDPPRAAISDLEKEVEMDKQDLARLEALQRGISKKQELLAELIKERDKFFGQE